MDAMFFIVLGATLVSFLLTLAFGRFVIPMLRALHAGQSIREVGPQWHNSKAGTPTMGGIMFIAAILLCTVGFGWKSMVENGDYTHLYVLGLALCYGLVGFADAIGKVNLKRKHGHTPHQKVQQAHVVAGNIQFVLKKSGDLSCDLYIPFWNLDLEIPTAVYMIFAAFVIVGCVNAVNLTDGVDGLSSSVTIPVMVFFAATAYIYGRTTLALLPATVAGGLAAFLCYNFHPAKVFMGDTGSLFLGGMVCGMAFALDMPLILMLVGIIYICETLSVILQVTYFKLTHGKRIFKMTPIHHHFELCGWKEEKIVFVFTAITLVMCVLAYLGVMNRY